MMWCAEKITTTHENEYRSERKDGSGRGVSRAWCGVVMCMAMRQLRGVEVGRETLDRGGRSCGGWAHLVF